MAAEVGLEFLEDDDDDDEEEEEKSAAGGEANKGDKKPKKGVILQLHGHPCI